MRRGISYTIFLLILATTGFAQDNVNHYLDWNYRMKAQAYAAAGLFYYPSGEPGGFAATSVLSKGEWYKLRVEHTGIHKITFENIQELGVDVASIDPDGIRLFGNGNGMVPELNSLPRPDDLSQYAIYIEGAEDGSFDEDDYILFFAEASLKWIYNPFKQVFEHETNIYDDFTYYFLNIGADVGKRIENFDGGTIEPNVTTDQYNDFFLHEYDMRSLTKSGKLWVGEEFNEILERDFIFDFPGLINDSEFEMTVAYTARTDGDSFLEIYAYNEEIANLELPHVNLSSPRFAMSTSKNYSVSAANEQLELMFRFVPYNTMSFAWLDFIEMNFKRDLRFNHDQLFFRNVKVTRPNNIAQFKLSGSNENIKIWEVTDRHNIRELISTYENDTVYFIIPTEILREFIAWDGTTFLEPEFLGKVPNQNLHHLQPEDLIIVSHPDFLDYADELGALHLEVDGLNSLVVTTEEIYNEFSSGALDPGAIRDFVRMLYERGKNLQIPKYLLLFGDGNYDPKDRDGITNNFIPAYQSDESLLMTSSYVTDDFYALLDSTEGYNAATGKVDVGVGRLPVSNQEQARQAVDKIRHYVNGQPDNLGDWRNEICFIADDENDNLHMIQAEQLVTILDTAYKEYHLNKIYLDAYKQYTLSGGYRYPDVNTAINEAIADGALIINYTGHGGELGWSEEKVLDIPTINSWTNFDKLPLFLTATCEFSRFDNPELVSAGELVFLNPHGGGIALFTTTRIAYSTANFMLNRIFYKNAFKPVNGLPPRMGDIIRITKAESNGTFQKNFTLLGDPALRLSYPEYIVQTTTVQINDNPSEVDTISSLSRVTISGEIRNTNDLIISGFNGILYPKIYDKPVVVHTLANDNGSHEEAFEIQNKVIFEGLISVKDGEFSFSFVVPRDIDYNYGIGKVVYYAIDTLTMQDANGYHELIIGGVDEYAEIDDTGPEIQLYLNNTGFRSGDYVNRDPLLIAFVEDASGINFLGNGIGHDIIATIDGDHSNSIVLNSYYEPDMDNYKGGSIMYPINELSEGKHSLELLVWDVFNNSSRKTVEFYVSGSYDLNITEVMNYPNPFTTHTSFMFSFGQENEMIDVDIRIYTLEGSLVQKMSKSMTSSALNPETITWNGTNNNGSRLKSGTYLYNITVTNELGYKNDASGKLVIIN